MCQQLFWNCFFWRYQQKIFHLYLLRYLFLSIHLYETLLYMCSNFLTIVSLYHAYSHSTINRNKLFLCLQCSYQYLNVSHSPTLLHTSFRSAIPNFLIHFSVLRTTVQCTLCQRYKFKYLNHFTFHLLPHQCKCYRFQSCKQYQYFLLFYWANGREMIWNQATRIILLVFLTLKSWFRLFILSIEYSKGTNVLLTSPFDSISLLQALSKW